jgi:hypothetical protein
MDRHLNRRIIGWLMIFIGMVVFIAGAFVGNGANLLWATVALLGAGFVGPWPWWSKKPKPADTVPQAQAKNEAGTNETST